MNYLYTLKELGVTQEDMDRAKKELPVPMLSGEENSVYFAPSVIEGNGTFAMRDIAEGERIAPLRKNARWTLTGMMTNHSDKPNSKLIEEQLVALCGIPKHGEILADYLQIKEAIT